MELRAPPAWNNPAPRTAPDHSGCAEDWFARYDSPPDADALPSDLIARAFGHGTGAQGDALPVVELGPPGLVLPIDAINPAPRALDGSDLTDPRLAYLEDDALPDPDGGCIIGVIDDAIPFVHERLRLTPTLSRVAALWVQDARFDPHGPGHDLPAGTELRGAAIGTWLAQLQSGTIPTEDSLYRLSGVVDMTRQTTHAAAFAAGHGAAVALLAAGHAPGDRDARNRPLIGVNLAPKVIADSSGGLAPRVLVASVLFVITRARRLCRLIETRRGLARNSVRLPVVLNISLGLTAGPRNGTSVIERLLDQIADHRADDLGPVHIVLPSGNHRMARLRGTMQAGGTLGWQVPPDDRTVTPLEIWGPALQAPPDKPLQIGLAGPGFGPAWTAFTAAGQVTHLQDGDGRAMARAYHGTSALPGGGYRQAVTVVLQPTCPDKPDEAWIKPGLWHLSLPADAAPGLHDVSIQRDEVLRGFPREARQSRLYGPDYRDRDQAERTVDHDPDSRALGRVQRADTVNAYATGRRTLRAGAVSLREGRAVEYNSLIGTDRAGDLLVPVDRAICHQGMGICGRGSGSFSMMSGSSLAAPQVTRWLATALGKGARPGNRAAVQALAGGTPDGPPPILPPMPPLGRD